MVVVVVQGVVRAIAPASTLAKGIAGIMGAVLAATAPIGAPRTRLVTTPFVVVSAATFFFFLAVGIVLPTLPRFVHDGLGGNDVDVGIAIAAYSIGAILVRPLLTWTAGRFGLRHTMVAGAALGVVGYGLHVLVGSLVPLVAVRVLIGIAEAFQFVGAATIINNLSPPERRAEAASYFSVSVFLALGMGPVLGEALGRNGQFTTAFLCASLAAAASGFIAWWAPRDHPGVPGVSAEPADVISGWHRILHPAALATGAVLAFAMAGYTAWTAFLPLRADELSMNGAGGLFAIYSVLVLVLRLGGARVPERVGLGRSAAAALVGIGGGLVIMAVWGAPLGLLVGTIVLAFGISLLYPSLMALTVNGAPEGQRAAVVSTFTVFFEVGGAIGGVALGGVAAATSYQGSFLVGGVLALAGLPLLWFVVVQPRRLALAGDAQSAAAT